MWIYKIFQKCINKVVRPLILHRIIVKVARRLALTTLKSTFEPINGQEGHSVTVLLFSCLYHIQTYPISKIFNHVIARRITRMTYFLTTILFYKCRSQMQMAFCRSTIDISILCRMMFVENLNNFISM